MAAFGLLLPPRYAPPPAGGSQTGAAPPAPVRGCAPPRCRRSGSPPCDAVQEEKRRGADPAVRSRINGFFAIRVGGAVGWARCGAGVGNCRTRRAPRSGGQLSMPAPQLVHAFKAAGAGLRPRLRHGSGPSIPRRGGKRAPARFFPAPLGGPIGASAEPPIDR